MQTRIEPKQNNILHTRAVCPDCHFGFISGFDPENKRVCPKCKRVFVSDPQNIFNCTQYQGCNNAFYKDGCPALMSDGRFITYHNSSNELTENMRKVNNFKNPNEFRRYMQNNGDLFRTAERDFIEKQNSCYPTKACSQGWYDLWSTHNGNWANKR